MKLSSVQDWIAWAGIVVPLLAMAWAAVQYVATQRREQKYREFEKLHRLMCELGTSGKSVLGNVAVCYELRKFPDYSEVIIRALRDIDVRGARADLLQNEIEETILFLGGGRTR